MESARSAVWHSKTTSRTVHGLLMRVCTDGVSQAVREGGREGAPSHDGGLLLLYLSFCIPKLPPVPGCHPNSVSTNQLFVL